MSPLQKCMERSPFFSESPHPSRHMGDGGTIGALAQSSKKQGAPNPVRQMPANTVGASRAAFRCPATILSMSGSAGSMQRMIDEGSYSPVIGVPLRTLVSPVTGRRASGVYLANSLRSHFIRLHALFPSGGDIRDFLPFCQAFEASGLNGLEMNEEVVTTGVGGDKSKTLTVVEPLDRSGYSIRHDLHFLFA